MSRADWSGRKTGVLVVVLVGLVMLAGITHLVGLRPLVARAGFDFGAVDTGPELATEWVFQGRVYEGELWDETRPLQGVPVSLYGANDQYPAQGEVLDSTTTDGVGWYGLRVDDNAVSYEYYYILETDSRGYESVGATSVGGVVRTANWIEYEIPLDGKTLTGNKFWDRPLTADTPTPTLIHTPTCTPTGATATPTLTPTLVQSPAPPTPTGLDLRVEHVELTQAIQCKDNSHCPDNAVPLISGKDTYVRVYVEVLGSSVSVPNVSARVTAKMSWGDYTTDPINPTITAKLNPQRSLFNDTLNFHLPTSVVDASGTLVVEINPGRTVAEVDYTNNQRTVNLTFVTTPPLIIVPIWIDYDYGGTQALVDGTMHYNMGYYLKNILPVGQIQWHILPGPVLKWTQQIGPGGGSWGSILAKLSDMRKKNASVPASAHWYAMVPFKIAQGGMCGLAYMPGNVAAGRVPVHHENFEDAADIMAHELGHNFNRQHSPCGVSPSDPNYPYANARLGDCGWDPQVAGGGKVQSWPAGFVVPATSFDVMSYCQDEWISEYTYRGILNYRGSSPIATGFGLGRQVPVVGAQSQRLSEEMRPYLFASGTVGGEGAELDPWAILERPEGSNDGSGEGPYHLRLVAENEEILFERHFSTETLQESWLPGKGEAGMEEEVAPAFYEVLPWYPDAARIQVWHGESLLAERFVSGHLPMVEVISPREGDFWPADGEAVIEWHADDEDGGPLWFDVSFSRNGGETWDVIATRLEENLLAVRSDQFPGTEGAMLRVSASDGVLTSDALSGPFSIEPKAPRVSISAPPDGGVVPAGVPLRLRGYAYDPEDGVLSGEAMEWDSDRDGWMGHGSALLVQGLSSGWHTLTLHAGDGDEQIGSDSVSILVGNRIYLPLITRG